MFLGFDIPECLKPISYCSAKIGKPARFLNPSKISKKNKAPIYRESKTLKDSGKVDVILQFSGLLVKERL